MLTENRQHDFTDFSGFSEARGQGLIMKLSKD